MITVVRSHPGTSAPSRKASGGGLILRLACNAPGMVMESSLSAEMSAAAAAAAAATAAWGRATSCRGRSNFQSRRKKALIGGGIGRTGDLPCGGS